VGDIQSIVELCGIIAGAVAAVSGSVWAVFRFGARLGRVLPISDRLHDLFGVNPVEQLHELVSKAHGRIGEIEIRQRIAERHLAIGVYVCDPSGDCEWANDYLCESFGIDSLEMRGFGWLSALHRDDRERVHREWMRSIEHHLPYLDQYTVVPRDGQAEWKAISEAWPVMSGTTIVCYVGYVTRRQ